MAELTKTEIDLLSKLVKGIEFELFQLGEDINNKDRLAYLTCSNEQEKIDYSKGEMQKLQKKFREIRPEIAEYIFALIQKHPTDNDSFEEKRKQIIQNFILEECLHTFELIISKGYEETVEIDSARDFLYGYAVDIRLYDKFLLSLIDAKRFLMFVEFTSDNTTQQITGTKHVSSNLTDKEIILKALQFLRGKKGHVEITEAWWEELPQEIKERIALKMYQNGFITHHPYNQWQFQIEFCSFDVLQNPDMLNDAGDRDNELKSKVKTASEKKGYSHRQIAIAYCIMGVLITSENADKILAKHSQLRSTEKLLAKRINNPSNLAKITGNKTTDTKSLKDLRAAKRLISGMKNTKAINEIARIISAFETSYHNKY